MREQQQRGVRRLEFHISREARDRYQFDQALFTTTGNVIFANFRAARVFAQRMNQKRDLVNYPEKVVRAGQINAMGLIDEILHFVIGQYQQQRAPQAMAEALAWVEERLGRRGAAGHLAQIRRKLPAAGASTGRKSAWTTISRARPTAFPTGSCCWKSCSCSGWKI